METAPKRIGLEDMDPSKYMSFGSLYIIGVDSLMFPLDTIKTIIMAERVSFINKSKKAKQSLLKMTLKIAKREGIARFWRGIIRNEF
jgi:hypothetical protein